VNPGSHAAGDGSFGRSAGIQAGRAALLIGVAVLIGFLLLHRGGSPSGAVPVVVGSDTTVATLMPTSVTNGSGATTGTTAKTTPTTSATQPRAPQDIKVLVANGTTTSGLAGRISNLVHAKGYVTLASTNSTQKPASTIVYFQPSYSADAAALAAKFNLPPTAVQAMPSPPPVPNLNGANILIVVGPDLANAASTTSST
jgi:hypothetical protein